MQDNHKNTFVEDVFDDLIEEDERMGLVYPQINSYEIFIQEKISEIIERFTINFGNNSSSAKRAKGVSRRLKIKNVQIQQYPTHDPMVDAHLFKKATEDARDGLKKLYPNEARSITGKTYDVPIFIDLVEVDEEDVVVDVVLKRHFFFRVPVMIGSCFSNNEREEDYGGYFIINGTERVLVTQEAFAINKIIKYSNEEVEIHCKSGNVRYQIPIITRLLKKNGIIYWKATAKLKESIPIPILLCAILPHANAIDPFIEFKDLGDCFLQSIYYVDSGGFKWTRDDALSYIYSRLNMTVGLPKSTRIREAQLYLSHNLLIHCVKKKELLLEMIRVLLHDPVDDMNHLKNKSYYTTSILLSTLLYELITQTQYLIYNELAKIPNDEAIMRHHIIHAFDAFKDKITNGLVAAMGSGVWGASSDSREVPNGISQALDRTSHISYLNLTRRISVALKSVKMEARNVHGSYFGYLCISETSEGEDVGLTKLLSIYCITSLERLGKMELLEEPVGLVKTRVFVNGDFCGYSSLSPRGFMRDFVFKRRAGDIPFDVGISYREDEELVYIRTNEGRLIRPLFVADGGICTGDVEYLDAEEVEHAYIAMYSKDVTLEHTHVELLPSVMFGMCANTIPFANMNQGPRITYYSSMAKQGIGVSILNDRDRFTNSWQTSETIQRPLVTTNILRNTRLNYYPNGVHLICLINIWGGFNQEDSFVINRNAIQFKGLSSYAIHCYSHVIKMSNITCNQDKDKYPRIPVGDYVVDVGTKVEPGDFIINCEYRIPTKDQKGIVEAVRVAIVGKDEIEVHVKVRTMYEPMVGDKISTRHAQKGVISRIENPENMPWSQIDGCSVDIIKNPHSIPSRMTQGELAELLVGKLICLKPPPGVFYDATAFNEHATKCHDLFKEFDVDPKYRYELMYDGTTGALIPCIVEVGVIYVNILKHRVINKSYARATGPLDLITRQPTKGRSRKGGIRFGEMERDALIAAKASLALQDRIDCCDAYDIKTCPSCGRMDSRNRTRGNDECYCGTTEPQISIKTRYAFKSVLQQIQAININVSCFKE